MKVLFISTQYPYPKDNGKKIILSSFLEYFIEKMGEENVEYVVVGDTNYELKPILKVRSYKKPNSFNQLLNLLVYTMLSRKKSIQESILYNSKVKKDLTAYIQNNEFDLVIYDTVRISQMFEGVDFPDTNEFVYLDDLFSVRYEKMLHTMKKYPEVDFNVIGNFIKFLPFFMRKIASFNTFNKFLLKIERKIIQNRENETVFFFPNSLLISQNEATTLNLRTNSSSVKSIRPVVINGDSKRYERDPDEFSFVFLGALNIPHNNVSICNFLRENMNELIDEIPNIKIYIIGKNPSATLKELVLNYSDNVELMGYVEDLDLIFKSACGMIIPLLFGSGVKLKTLEAFSRGLPVIATDYGIEGIDLPLEGECLVENNIENYVQHMKSLTDKTNNLKISKLAYDFFYENYSKEAVYKQYDNVFNTNSYI